MSEWYKVTPVRDFQNVDVQATDTSHCGNVNDLISDFDVTTLVGVLGWVSTPAGQAVKGGASNWDMLMLLQYMVSVGYTDSTTVPPAPDTYYRIMPSNNTFSHTGFPSVTVDMRIWSPNFWQVTLLTMDYAEGLPAVTWDFELLTQLWVSLGGWTDKRIDWQ